jgi:5-(carboxyamino)imidazole ribonucleotide synthase
VPDALLPGILKTARLGYDGKGQVRVATAPRWPRPGSSWAVPCVLEKMLPLAADAR